MSRLIALVMMLLAGACSPQEGQVPETGITNTAQSPATPDLNGVWQVLNSANYDLEPHAARQGTTELLGAIAAEPPGKGFVSTGTIPYLPEALAQRNLNFANRRTEDPEAKCFRPGVPRAAYMPYPFQIFQTDSEIFIAYQFASATRTVNLVDHMEAPFDSWMGWSNGHWEGNTLVVEVTGMNGQTWLDRAGNFASANARVLERYTPIDADHLRYEATVADPTVYSEPWTLTMSLYRHVNENPEFLEFKCVEFAEEMMYGYLKKTTDETNGGSGND